MPERLSRFRYVLLLIPSWVALSTTTANAATLASSASGMSVTLQESTGTYAVTSKVPAWTFSGSVGAQVVGVQVRGGKDRLGAYREIAFAWKTDQALKGAIRLYNARPLIRFAVTTPQATAHLSQDFPAFMTFPQGLHPLSYREDAMSPPSFRLENNGTPWFLFDDDAHTAALSSGSDFLVSQMHGDGKTLIASGLNPKLTNLPAGFTHTSWLTIGSGIGATIHTWGDALTGLSGKPRTRDNADLLVKYLGYWTDNGAFYYYNYDKSLGYAATIQEIADHYRAQQIPIRYMQLDSWWYQKTRTSPSGVVGGPKRASLPEGTWNAYGGTLDYSASPDLFPQGLATFQKELGLPLVVHGRWIDPTSPYHQQYKISGLAPIDPRWWNDRMDYLKASGVVTYEQDWLNEIYLHSPEMASTLTAGPAFADNMARAAKERKQTLQYCMPLPRFFLQGTKYGNLTTIRTSGDRFERNKWFDFLYTSMLADAVRIRPWTDVFLSTEMGNLTIAALSSGPVGNGDAIGKESRDNLLRAARADGVLVKPDAPLLPTDESLIADARGLHHPLVASTYTDNGQRTAYAFAYTRSGDSNAVSFTPESLGLSDSVYIYKTSTGAGRLLKATKTYTDMLASPNWDLYIAAPIGRSGIAFLGDMGKIAATGRQRIAAIQDTPDRMTVTVILASNETAVTLHGYAASAPRISVAGGTLKSVIYQMTSGQFTFQIAPDSVAKKIDGDPVRIVKVVLQTR